MLIGPGPRQQPVNNPCMVNGMTDPINGSDCGHRTANPSMDNKPRCPLARPTRVASTLADHPSHHITSHHPNYLLREALFTSNVCRWVLAAWNHSGTRGKLLSGNGALVEETTRLRHPGGIALTIGLGKVGVQHKGKEQSHRLHRNQSRRLPLASTTSMMARMSPMVPKVFRADFTGPASLSWQGNIKPNSLLSVQSLGTARS